MGAILDKITEAIKEMIIGMIESNLTNMFTDVNDKVGTIAAEVGQTPSGWNSGIYSMIRGLSESVIIPIAGIIITFVLCYELITMITERNNLHDVDTWMFFKWFFKAFVAIYLVTNTFDIVMAVFDIGQHVVSGAGGFISGSTNIDIASTLATMRTSMEAMGVGELLGLAIETLIISLCLKIMSILITVILYGRMIEISRRPLPSCWTSPPSSARIWRRPRRPPRTRIPSAGTVPARTVRPVAGTAPIPPAWLIWLT